MAARRWLETTPSLPAATPSRFSAPARTSTADNSVDLCALTPVTARQRWE